jgi:uracil-DNA glycosylase
MTRDEKKLLYTLVKTAANTCYGYAAPDFTAETPQFSDDLSPDISDKISAITSKIAVCNRCPLAKTRTKTVPGIGVTNPVVLVIGEGPGYEEDQRGEPFVGPAGQLLDKMLAAINLSRQTNCFIANIVKCRPPQNRVPTPEEAAACASFLEAQIFTLKPQMILAVGSTAAKNMLKTTDGVTKLRGRFYNWNTIPLLVTYHPSALLRDAALKRPAWEDLKFFRSKLIELIPDYAQSTKS